VIRQRRPAGDEGRQVTGGGSVAGGWRRVGESGGVKDVLLWLAGARSELGQSQEGRKLEIGRLRRWRLMRRRIIRLRQVACWEQDFGRMEARGVQPGPGHLCGRSRGRRRRPWSRDGRPVSRPTLGLKGCRQGRSPPFLPRNARCSKMHSRQQQARCWRCRGRPSNG
jgi:hypothetical protein